MVRRLPNRGNTFLRSKYRQPTFVLGIATKGKDARTIAKLNMNPNAGTNLIKIPLFSDYGTSFIIVNLGSLLKD